MKLFCILMLWCVLFIFMPVVAIVVLLLYPIVWIFWQFLRLVAYGVEAILQTLRAILLLPARLLGVKPTH